MQLHVHYSEYPISLLFNVLNSTNVHTVCISKHDMRDDMVSMGLNNVININALNVKSLRATNSVNRIVLFKSGMNDTISLNRIRQVIDRSKEVVSIDVIMEGADIERDLPFIKKLQSL